MQNRGTGVYFKPRIRNFSEPQSISHLGIGSNSEKHLELTFLGNTIYLEHPSSAIVDEVAGFVKFLESFSERKVGQRSLETFTGKYIRCGIRIIATRAVREAGLVEGRRQVLESWIRAGYPNIYLVGADTPDNIKFMRDIVEAVQETYPELEIVKTYQYEAQIKMGDERKIVRDVLMHLHYPNAIRYILTEEELVRSIQATK